MKNFNNTDDKGIAILELLEEISAGYEPTAEEMSMLENTETLDLAKTDIPGIPSNIDLLRNLRELDVSENSLLELPETIGNLPELIKLNVSNNILSSLPKTIGNLSELITLDVSNNILSSLPKTIGNLSKLTELNVSDNVLEVLPESIGNLSSLTEFMFFGNELAALPDSICELYGLTEFDATYNKLNSLPENIGDLYGLIELNVTGNALDKLPESIGKISGLEELLLCNNNLTEFPESFKSLENLKYLDISNNGFETLPDWLDEYKKLQILLLSDNPIKKLPSCIGNMKHIISLDLFNIHLKKVPDFISKLSRLAYLNLSSNNIKKLPDWLGNMKNLKNLLICDLNLKEIPGSFLKLKIPFFTDKMSLVKNANIGICLEDTKLSLQPISLFDQSRDKSYNFKMSRSLLENYFNANKIPIREAKVIFLGDGKVGKTYTIQRLLNDCKKGNYPTKETHGILIENINEIRDELDYKIRIWDFGGQDIMHEMHRCFLTDRTCYVVMVDTRTNKQTGRARYWLRTVQSVAPNAPVLLLVNEISGSKNLDLDSSTLYKEFPNLVNIQYCSSLNATDDEFRQKIKESIIDQALALDSCEMKLPESWEEVRQNLLKQKENSIYYISKSKFHDLCDQYNVPNDNSLRAWLLTWFNDLGVCFSYHLGENGYEQTTDYQILDPMWLTSAVYKIIWEKERNEDGIISLSEINNILKIPGSSAMKKEGIPCLENVSYNKTECQYVLEIMRMFCISYPADDKTEFMPTICKSDSKMEPTPKTWKQHIAYKYKYTFLPESVLHRLMIYCYSNLRPGKRWRKGFWLESPAHGLSAVIRTIGENNEENILQIDLYSQNKQYDIWLWLQPLCKQIEEINNTLSLRPDSYVLAENNEEEKWFSLDTIWKWHLKGEKYLQGEESYFEIQPLLLQIYGKYFTDLSNNLRSRRSEFMVHGTGLVYYILLELEKDEAVDFSKPLNESILPYNTPAEQNMSKTQDLISAINRNSEALEKNTLAINASKSAAQQSRKLLEAVRDNIIELPDELTNALINELSKDKSLKTTAEEISLKSESVKRKRLRDLISTGANFTTIAQAMASLYSEYGPMISELLRHINLIP